MKQVKHVGSYGNKPCIVLFREVPNEADQCLVVLTNNLGPELHQDVMRVLESNEGQDSNDISQVFDRYKTTNGDNILRTLHSTGKIIKVPVDMVSLTPFPNRSVPLADVNAEIRRISEGNHPSQNDKRLQDANGVSLETDPEMNRQAADARAAEIAANEAGDPVQIAQNLLVQASMLEEDAKMLKQDAKTKKEEAYRLAPDLRPKRKTTKSADQSDEKSDSTEQQDMSSTT